GNLLAVQPFWAGQRTAITGRLLFFSPPNHFLSHFIAAISFGWDTKRWITSQINNGSSMKYVHLPLICLDVQQSFTRRPALPRFPRRHYTELGAISSRPPRPEDSATMMK